jgi:hypothetical protein
MVRCGVDEIEGHEAREATSVLRLDDEMCEDLGHGIDDDPAQLPTDAIGAAHLATDRELLCRFHRLLLSRLSHGLGVCCDELHRRSQVAGHGRARQGLGHCR